MFLIDVIVVGSEFQMIGAEFRKAFPPVRLWCGVVRSLSEAIIWEYEGCMLFVFQSNAGDCSEYMVVL